MMSSGMGSLGVTTDPGYTATDLNDHRGFQSVEQGAEAVVGLAQLEPNGPTGGFFDAAGPVPW